MNSFEYLSDINDNLICCICHAPFTTPVSSPCGHTFCNLCILTSLSTTTAACPIDRQPLTRADLVRAPIVLENLVQELQVKCMCGWTGERALLESHPMDRCLNLKYTCQELGCGRVVLRNEVKEHREVCEGRMRECEACQEKVLSGDYEVHILTCDKVPIECEFCSASVARGELAEHQEKTCPEVSTSCPHLRFGCLWQGPRRDLTSSHLPTICPFERMKTFFELHESKLAALILENQGLQSQLDTLRHHVLAIEDARRAESAALAANQKYFAEVMDVTADRMARLVEEHHMDRLEMGHLKDRCAALEARMHVAELDAGSRQREEVGSIRALCRVLEEQVLGRGPGDGMPVPAAIHGRRTPTHSTLSSPDRGSSTTTTTTSSFPSSPATAASITPSPTRTLLTHHPNLQLKQQLDGIRKKFDRMKLDEGGLWDRVVGVAAAEGVGSSSSGSETAGPDTEDARRGLGGRVVRRESGTKL
ncbi:uncharacterized protein EV422DRAFT_570919 [Fimicolochytrium jonesii]|uniref:uncharacterized protein n=1 Tax=Fimicolochytrium jonesii TaxID=1396493 RepID=UPI0022FF08E0|nr:uncharacterized protein EV422DRAFT_570919 [Fimicolochytrium jonesii]KAI8817295.1 hypothetical protein EV422DRAFT_570919 [Fimicolochytrium jonesii]